MKWLSDTINRLGIRRLLQRIKQTKITPRTLWTAIQFEARTSTRYRLIFFFLLVSLAPLIIVGLITFISSRSVIQSNITQFTIDSLVQVKVNLELKLKTYEDITQQFMSNQSANRLVEDYAKATTEIDQFSKIHDIQTYLLNYTVTDPNLGTEVISTSQRETYFGTGLTWKNGRNFKKSSIYRRITQSKGGAVWGTVSGNLSGNGRLVVVGRDISNLYTGERLGVLAFFISENFIDQTINFNYYESDSGNKNDKNFYLVIDDQGRIVSAPLQYKGEIGKSLGGLMGNPARLRSLLQGEITQGSFPGKFNHQQVLVTFKSLNNGWHLLSMAPASFLVNTTRVVGLVVLILGLISGVLAVYISFKVAEAISRPLNQVMEAMKRAEDGDLTVRVAIDSKDEFGKLGTSFNHMVAMISQLLVNTKGAINAVVRHSKDMAESSEQSATSSESVARAMSDISKGTMEQTSETEKSSQQMTELANEIDSVVFKAAEVEMISDSTKALSFRSKDAVELLIIKSKETSEITNTIIKDIDELNSSAGQIRDITAMMEDIAEKTNLLAINAAIEAARAGESGRGFAVVAKEVNKLAAQTQEAAQTIETILQTIQSKTNVSTQNADQAHVIVEDQMSAVATAERAFDEIIAAMDDVVSRMGEMSKMVQQINNFKEQTLQSIVNISSISEETAASAEEVTASTEEQTAIAGQVKQKAEELRLMAETLVESVERFQIADANEFDMKDR
ncbi:MAG TPA: methyl-accepting chemotaxis protein [Bacillota bacterium]